MGVRGFRYAIPAPYTLNLGRGFGFGGVGNGLIMEGKSSRSWPPPPKKKQSQLGLGFRVAQWFLVDRSGNLCAMLGGVFFVVVGEGINFSVPLEGWEITVDDHG